MGSIPSDSTAFTRNYYTAPYTETVLQSTGGLKVPQKCVQYQAPNEKGILCQYSNNK